MDQRIIRLSAGAALAAAATLGLSACSLLPGGTTTQPTSNQGSNEGSNGSGSSTSGSNSGSGSSSEGQTENVLDIHAGDCINIPDENADSISDVTVVECSAEHSYEVFHEVTVTGDTYPGEDSLDQTGDKECGAAFDSWVADPSKFMYNYMPPSQESWEQADDRIILCIASPTDGGTSTGSAGK